MMEEPKQDHHNDAASKPPYSWRVMIIYSLFGPPLGIVSLILFIIVVLPVVASEPPALSNQFFRNMPEFFLTSYWVGGIPAILTGLLAMLLRLKRNLPGIAAVTAAGALLSVIYPSIMFGMSASSDSGLFLGCGLAAAFVLSVFLPKP